MILKEDNAPSYAKALANTLSAHIKDENPNNAFAAWGGSFNRERLAKPDYVFNYDNAQTFAQDVADAIRKFNPQIYTRFRNIINHLATDYANKKMVTSKKVISSVQTEEVNYFPY